MEKFYIDSGSFLNLHRIMIIHKDISIDIDIEATPKEFFTAKLK